MCINQELDLTEKKVILSSEGFIKQYYIFLINLFDRVLKS